jgi:hypothetical protein
MRLKLTIRFLTAGLIIVLFAALFCVWNTLSCENLRDSWVPPMDFESAMLLYSKDIADSSDLNFTVVVYHKYAQTYGIVLDCNTGFDEDSIRHYLDSVKDTFEGSVNYHYIKTAFTEPSVGLDIDVYDSSGKHIRNLSTTEWPPSLYWNSRTKEKTITLDNYAVPGQLPQRQKLKFVVHSTNFTNARIRTDGICKLRICRVGSWN